MRDHLNFADENKMDIGSEWGDEPLDDKPIVLSKKTRRISKSCLAFFVLQRI